MKRIPRPSPAMIVAIIALIVAIGGTATALPGRLIIGQKSLRQNSVGARSLGRAIQAQAVIWSKDPVGWDGEFTEEDGEVVCPARAPFAFDPTVMPMGPNAYEINRSVSKVNKWGGPRGYYFEILSDKGGFGFTMKVSCLPRR